MRRLLTWLLVSLGIAALLRRLRRRARGAAHASDSFGAAGPPQPADASDPAEALRQKLADTRTAGTGAAGSEPEGSVEERRAEIHAEARAAVDEMRAPSDD